MKEKNKKSYLLKVSETYAEDSMMMRFWKWLDKKKEVKNK